MAKQEKTSPRVARVASKTILKKSASKIAKSVAGSALAQTRSGKTTSAKVAKPASSVLRDGKSGSAPRSVAGSVLTQRTAAKGATTSSPKSATGKTAKKATSGAASAPTQHVATRRTADGKPVRVVLTPYRGGSLRRDHVESVVSTVLAKHKKK